MSIFNSPDFEEEDVCCEDENQKFRFQWKGKIYTSLSDMRKEVSTNDLKTILASCDFKIAKYDKKLKFANFRYHTFTILSFIGLSTLIFQGLFPASIKNIINIFSPLFIVGGMIGKNLNFNKYLPMEKELENICIMADEIDEEINLREEKVARDEKAKEIFCDIYGQEASL